MNNLADEKVKAQVSSMKKMVEDVLSSFKNSDVEVKPFYIVASYKGYTIQVSFGIDETLMLIRIARLVPKKLKVNTEALYALNSESYLGNHILTSIEEPHRFYIYKISCWNLGDGEADKEKFLKILNDGCIEADKGLKALLQ